MKKFLLATLLLAVAACSEAEREPTKPRAGVVAALKTTLPSTLCGLEYFVSCFNVSPDECEDVVAVAAEFCMRELGIDSTEEWTRSDARNWGERVGSCAGIAVETKLADRKRRDPRCDDMSAWQ